METWLNVPVPTATCDRLRTTNASLEVEEPVSQSPLWRSLGVGPFCGGARGLVLSVEEPMNQSPQWSSLWVSPIFISG